MKMILNLEIKGMKMRMGMKRSKTRMLLCVNMKTRLRYYWQKNPSLTGIQSKTSACAKQMGKWQLWD